MQNALRVLRAYENKLSFVNAFGIEIRIIIKLGFQFFLAFRRHSHRWQRKANPDKNANDMEVGF